MNLKKCCLVIVISWLSCGVTFAETAVATLNPVDPYEKFNRVMYNFNEIVDRFVLKPIATLYNKITPKPINKGISNIYSNIDTIPTVINDFLQGNFYQTTSDTWRLALNTTIGIGGFFDVATPMGLEPNSEDLGLTLARWGWTNSNYLVLPFLGPTTVRDAPAFFANYYLFTIYPWINPPKDRYRLYLGGIVVKRANLLRYQGVLDQAALDKYVFLRDAYLQRRGYLIQRNNELSDPYFNVEEVKK